jgi:hypothetical protein
VSIGDRPVLQALGVLGLERRLLARDQLVDLPEVELGDSHIWDSPPDGRLDRWFERPFKILPEDPFRRQVCKGAGGRLVS